jgi:hypothetical protein
MRETALSAYRYMISLFAVSFGLKSTLIPGITVSVGLPYRGRDRVILIPLIGQGAGEPVGSRLRG